MNFNDWKPKAVELRLIEAMETHLALPMVHGPRAYGNSMPEIVRERWKDAAPSRTKYRKRLSPDAISRMEECWTWTSTMLSAGDREFIDEWARLKVTKGRRLNEMSGESGAIAKEINRRKHRVCSVIANVLNRNHQVRLNSGDCDVSETEADIDITTVSSETRDPSVNHWIATGARPHLDPGLPRERLLDHRAIRARHSNQNRSLGGQR